jgi:phage gp29-like protein
LQIFASRAGFALTLLNFGIMNPRHLEEVKSNAENVLRGELEKLVKMQADLQTAVDAIQATFSKIELFKNERFLSLKARSGNRL